MQVALQKYIYENDPNYFTRDNSARKDILSLSVNDVKAELESIAKNSFIDYQSKTNRIKKTPLAQYYYMGKNYFQTERDYWDAVISECIIYLDHTRTDPTKTLARPRFGQIQQSMPTAKPKKDLYILSDFHGRFEGYNKAIEKINEGKKVVILGDAMDRGERGIAILEELIKLQSRGLSVEYLPGNHDEFLCKCLYDGMRQYERTGNIQEFQKIAIRNAKTTIDMQSRNGVEPTYRDVIELAQFDPNRLYKLGKWLESQPLLALESDRNETLALGHAAFDMELYQKRYTLKDYIEEKDSRIKQKAFACLWYRNQKGYEDCERVVDLPNKMQADNIIIGHTPNAQVVQIIGRNGTRNAICVDSGLIGRVKRNEKCMLCYQTKLENQRKLDPDVTSLHIME